MSKWQPWQGIEEFPTELIGVPCLARINTRSNRSLDVLTVSENDNGNRIGIVGNCFHFDREIIEYKSLEEFIKE